jgi:hypothetical protein
MSRIPDRVKRTYRKNEEVKPTIRACHRSYVLESARLEKETVIATYLLERTNAHV